MMRYPFMKTDHFKLDITNRSVRITIFSNVNENFAQEYRESLAGEKYNENVRTLDIDFDNMTPSMQTVFAKVPVESLPESKKESKMQCKQHNKPSDNFKGKYHEYNYKKRLKKRAEMFRSLAYINFRVPNVHFVTLTFDPRTVDYATDLNKCHHAFQMFIKRIRRRYSDFVYVATFSRQKNNNWHYHMLCNFDINVKNRTIQDLWQNGMTHSTPILSYTELGSRISYCIDNMYKVAWSDLKGENGYLKCRGLQTPIVFRSWNDAEKDKAYEYLAKIINSTDKPLDIMSELLERSDDPDTAPRISYKISHKVFDEFFTDIKIAKPRKGAVK